MTRLQYGKKGNYNPSQITYQKRVMFNVCVCVCVYLCVCVYVCVYILYINIHI